MITRYAALALLLYAASAAGAEQAHRVYKIGVLNEAWAANHPTVEGLKAGLRDWGYTEGQDVTYDIRFTKGDPAAIREAAKTFVEAGVDVMFTSNESATLAARKATDRIPIVFTLIGDPVTSGIVASLAQPGGNLTGISNRAIALGPKRLEMLKMLAPKMRRVWFIHHVTDITGWGVLDHIRIAAPKLNIELIVRTVNNEQERDSALKEILPGDGVLAPEVDTLDIPAKILEIARSPSIFPTALWVEHGAIISYGPELRAQGMQAARLVAKILRGTRPQDLPVESADRLDLAINLNTARQLALKVPPRILVRANVVQQ